jgi:pimeloyl-ACP methyl ester carboxylesterase
MPSIDLNGASLFYEDSGGGEEAVVFLHGVLRDRRVFERQFIALRSRIRCIALDFRGHGQSSPPEEGYEPTALAADVLALLAFLGVSRAHLVGLGLGGYVALRVALDRPELTASLALIGTSADQENPANLPRYRWLVFLARWLGPGLMAEQALQLLFGPRFLNDPYRAAVRSEWRRRMGSLKRHAVGRVLRAYLARPSLLAEIESIRKPALLLVGEMDLVTPADESRRILTRIPEAELKIIPRSGHTPTIEESDEVNARLSAFIQKHASIRTERSVARAPGGKKTPVKTPAAARAVGKKAGASRSNPSASTAKKKTGKAASAPRKKRK